MSMDSQICYFLGANTPAGFYSLYHELIDPAQAQSIYILKGGPGCGKSTLMRTVAAAMEEAGHPCEYILCSGDPDSLDGLVIPGCRTAFVDGTAPHVVEPQYPGVVDQYVNLGECYDRAGLGDIRGEIMRCMGGYKECYRRAYRCLDASAQIAADMRAALVTPAVEARVARRAKGILARELKKIDAEPGGVTHRFLSGVTHRGPMCLFATAEAQCKRIYELQDTYGLSHLMLEPLLAGAVAAGYDVIACPSPMDPTRLEHLLIPALSLAFVTATPALPYQGRSYRRVRMDAMADADALRLGRARLRFSKKVSAALLGEAVDSLAEAKAMHDRLESLYNPYVDFARVGKTADALTAQLLSETDGQGNLHGKLPT